MKQHLTIRFSRKPTPGGTVNVRNVTVRERILRLLLGAPQKSRGRSVDTFALLPPCPLALLHITNPPPRPDNGRGLLHERSTSNEKTTGTAATPDTVSPLTVSTDAAPALVKKIGKTTYRVKVHFSQTSRETMSDKIKRMLRNEVSQM